MISRAFRSAVLLACLGPFSGCVVPPSASQLTAPPRVSEYLIAPPDTLQVIVRGVDPEITRDVIVRPDGKVSFDLIDELEVVGKTVAQVRTELAENLKKFIVAPDVTVLLTASNSRRFYVFGEVEKVGSYPLIGEVTAIEGLASAGGATFLGSPNGAWLARPQGEGREVYRVRFTDIQRGDGKTNYTLQPGDVLYVPPGISAQIGNTLRIIFYPLQQVIGLGGRLIKPTP